MNKYDSQMPSPSRKRENSLSLKFKEVEVALRISLPESAYTDATWWNNDAGHPHATAWLEAGWRTLAVDLSAQQVAFEPRLDAGFVPKENRFGCMSGTITIAPGVDLTAPGDEVWNAEEGRLLNG